MYELVAGDPFVPQAITMDATFLCAAGSPQTNLSVTRFLAPISDVGVASFTAPTPRFFGPVNPAPILTSLGPNSATVGDPGVTVTVMGGGFVEDSTVLFDGVAQPTTFVGGMTLEVTVTAAQLAAAGTFNVTVFNPAPGGGTSTALPFTVNNPSPVLTSLGPNSATAGDPGGTVTVMGAGFVNGSTVLFDGVAQPTTFVSGTTLEVMVTAAQLAAAGTFNVTVFNSGPGGGTSAGLPFTVNNPVPALTSLGPNSATAGDPGFTLNVTGTGFVNGSTVLFDGVAQATTFVNGTTLEVMVSAAQLAAAGTFNVAVFNAAPGGGTSAALPFTVNNPAPTLTSLSPNSATAGDPGFTLTLTGGGFVDGSTVRFDGVAQATTFVNGTTLEVMVPAAQLAAAGTFGVTVFNPAPGGGTSGTLLFTVNNPVPTLTLLSQNSATVGDPGFTLFVIGTGFVEFSTVEFDGAALTTTFFNGTTLEVAVPAGQLAVVTVKNVTVVNPAPGGGVSNALPFAVNNPVPTIASLTPAMEVVGSPDLTLTVDGSNFVNGSIVTWETATLATTFIANTRLRATAPAALLAVPGTTAVAVENPAPGGGVSNGLPFVINALPLVNLTSALPNGRVGLTYGAGLNATGGVPPYAWSITGGTLHQGLQLNPAGSIDGVPGEAGNFFVTLEVADNSGQTASQAVSLSILGLIVLSPSKLSIDLTPNGTVVSRTVTASVEGGPVEIEASASTTSGVDWLSVSPQTATADGGAPAGTTVTIDSEALPIGVHIGQVDYSPTNGPTKGLDFPATSLPVIVTVNPTPTLFQLSQTGLRFTGVAGAGDQPGQTFSVGNLGVGDLPWTVASSTVSGSKGGINWLSASPPNGTSTAGNPLPEVEVAVDTTGLAADRYYGQVEVGAENTANSPQVVIVVLNLFEQGAAQVGPVVEPLGLFFVAPQGGEPPPPEEIEIANVSGEPITFTSVRLPEAGADPFGHGPAEGTIEPGATAAVSVDANPGTLAPGEYRAALEVAFSNGVVRSAELLLLVTPPPVGPLSQSSPLSQSIGGTKRQGGCTPARLVGNFTSLGQGFTAPAAWPSTVAVEVADDCGGAISEGSVVASFTIGAPLALVSLSEGQWENSWVPVADSAGAVTVTVDMESLAGLKGSSELTGSIAVNDAAPPNVPDGAIVSSASFDPDLPLSPGTLVTIFGSDLSEDEAAALALPLPLQLGGTSVQIAGRALPLLFASARQVNALVPYELPANTSQQLIIRRGGTISHPSRIELATAQPDVFAFPTREGIVVDVAGRLVTMDNPVAPGDIIVIFAAGLGPVAPEVTSGDAAPVSPLAFAAGEVTVTIGGLAAPVFFAGLTPGFAGLYQINALVPEGVTLGDAITLVVRVGDGVSRSVTIAVR